MRPIAFEKLYGASTDPWGYRTRWYETRKRDLLLASLPRPHFARGCEIGCSNGELTAFLAARCDALIATDGNDRAVTLARERTRALGNVAIERHWHPESWPRGKFDLIVVSEIGYYLDAAGLVSLAAFCRRSLAADGVVAACHWRYAIDDCDWTGDGVHRELGGLFPWARTVCHVEADFVLEIWCADRASVAQREGIAEADVSQPVSGLGDDLVIASSPSEAAKAWEGKEGLP